MPGLRPLTGRRHYLATSVLAGAIGVFVVAAHAETAPAADDTSIRPFQFHASDEALADLRRRIAATKWPSQETVSDATQGVQLETMRELAHYWQTDYDWRKVEARLNALPQFMTTIDGVDIHLIHVRSKHPNALPVIITHGWPGSIIEQLKIIEPLTNPTAHGGNASDAFDVVIPSMPGYGFSAQPTTAGWDAPRIARACTVLMKRLGYPRYVAQGGDWGALIVDLMGVEAGPELLGIHTNMPGAVPPEIDKAAFGGAPPPSGLSADERNAYEQLAFFYATGLAYAQEMGNHTRRRSTGSRIHPSASPLGSSTTTCAVTSSWRASLRVRKRASRETTSSRTSPSTG